MTPSASPIRIQLMKGLFDSKARCLKQLHYYHPGKLPDTSKKEMCREKCDDPSVRKSSSRREYVSLQDFIHVGITIGRRCTACGRYIATVGTTLPIIRHLRIEFLRGLLSRARVASLLCTTSLTSSAGSTVLYWDSGLGLSLRGTVYRLDRCYVVIGK